jgi:PBP1b-binding outer membrane lipoprotein LpoB
MKLKSILIVVLAGFFLAGCAGQTLTPVKVTVAGHDKTYVIGTLPVGHLGDEVKVVDRYDEAGTLQHPSDITTTGTVHDMVKAAAGSTGTAAIVTPVITPIVNDLK